MCGIAGLIHRGKSSNVGSELQGMLQALKHRGEDSTGYAPLFPRYGRDGGGNSLSEILSKIINLKMKLNSDKTCVPYSTRHSMKDKLRALRTPIELQYAILGNGKRTFAEGYGDGNPLVYLHQEIIKAEKLERWGK